jgi:hypothetical protein
MKDRNKKSVLASFLLLIVPLATHATGSFRQWLVSEIQSSSGSPTQGGLMFVAQRISPTQDVSWVNVQGPVQCSTEWAYFDAKLNPHFAAMVLTAQVTNKVLRVYVDDALSKYGGNICQVTNLSLLD